LAASDLIDITTTNGSALFVVLLRGDVKLKEERASAKNYEFEPENSSV
jgi:hypothetical protein